MNAVIPCSSKKMPVPCPAWLLYSASPLFSGIYQHAVKAYDRVFVLSGKHGLITTDTVLAPYDQRIDTNPLITQASVKEQALRLGAAPPVVSYCGAAYNKLLTGIGYELAMTGDLFTQASARGKQGSIKGQSSPLGKVLTWLFEKGETTREDLWCFCCQAWSHPTTRRCQFDRLIKSPFAIVRGDRIEFAFREYI